MTRTFPGLPSPLRATALAILWFSVCVPAGAQRAPAFLEGRVLDASGAVIPGAEVVLRLNSSGGEWRTRSDEAGRFHFDWTPAGEFSLLVSAPGFRPANRRGNGGRDSGEQSVTLQVAGRADVMSVTGEKVSVGESGAWNGSAGFVSGPELTESRPFTTEELLRRVPGVFARGEEGFGLRPNIGIRGLNPTRSAQVLLLEDGLPLAYAPYGDNASYYHPPIDRFDGVEVVKGGGQILYGPRTVGAVVNYLTPAPPEKLSGGLTLTGGNRGYVNAHGRVGGALAGTGILLDYLRKQGDGARENLRHALNDINVKALTALGPKQTLGVRFSALTEDSQVTYSGLREAEYQANPRANPFVNDYFTIRRFAASLRHSWAPVGSFLLSAAGYGTWFSRDWWRQSSNSNQRPNDSADPACGGMANLLTTCGNEGRLRDYSTWGLESRARLWLRRGKVRQEADFGARFHFEDQHRRQENGPLPTSRSGLLMESNMRKARAFSAFLQDAVTAGRWTFTPGVRVERIHYHRTNRLAAGGVSGETDLTVAVPGFAVAYRAGSELTVFAGAHRGFAPPRVEDVISNSTGAVVDLDSELSWNYEAGLRARVARALSLEGTYFRLDFENQIVPSSVAGGVGATLTNGGRTLHQGFEFASRVEWQIRSRRHRQYWRTAYTWLPTAEFRGARFSNVPGFGAASISGNRLPYAPANLLSSAVGYLHGSGLTFNLEAVYTGRQFGDDLNTVAGTPDGQRGLLPGHAVLNATLNVPVESWRATFFVTSKNLFDRLYIADRSRGILPGAPRLVQAGINWHF